MVTSFHFEARRRERGLSDFTYLVIVTTGTRFIAPDGMQYVAVDLGKLPSSAPPRLGAGWVLVLDERDVAVTCYRHDDPIRYIITLKRARRQGRAVRRG